MQFGGRRPSVRKAPKIRKWKCALDVVQARYAAQVKDVAAWCKQVDVGRLMTFQVVLEATCRRYGNPQSNALVS